MVRVGSASTEHSASTGRGVADGRRVLAPVLLVAAMLSVTLATLATMAAPVVGLTEPGVVVRYGLPLARVLLDVAALATVGFSLLPTLLGFDAPQDTESVARVARRAAVLTAYGWAVSALVSVVLSTAELYPGSAPSVGLVWEYVRQVGAGQGLVVSAGCALAYAAVGSLAVRFGEQVPAELRIVVAFFGLLSLPVTGHASNWRWHDVTMVSMELHVMGAAAWTGGLLVTVALVAGHRTLLSSVLPRFSRIATVAVVVVGASGVFNGLVELVTTPVVGFPASLVTTQYGQLVLGKALCLTVLAALGGSIRLRLLPAIAQRKSTALVGWATAELLVMGVAYGLGVVLTRAPVVG